ncbi:DnaJ domain-containing protein, partial [uncultured Desulfobulbus sp.]|uniref:J domain-containing protein n=1 Tax=uncultured Desulfobulbus sp. TaxID=239745 RepID=UPI00260C21E8
MNTLEREHIGRLIRRFAAGAATDDLLILIAEHSGLLEACKQLLAETKDPVTAAWLKSECEAAKTRPGLFQAEIEAILTIIKPSHEHADLFALLELEPGAGREAIKRNYRRLSRRYHPDSGGSKQDEDTFIRITQAYQRLLASADSTPGELPTPRRENSHWRNSVVAGTSDLRRAQKRRNVVVVALLSLTLIFVSLLAARTYNSRVMMSGLKNKGVAFVPPTPTTAATTPTPKSSEGHTANDGYAARTNGTPTSTTTTAATEQTEPTTKPITAAATDRAVSTENTPSPTTTTATAILPAEPAAHPETLVSLTPTARKQPVSPAHAEPGTPTTPTAEPAGQPTVAATQPPPAEPAAQQHIATTT